MSATSDDMISLLHELSILKELESEYAIGPKEAREAAEHESRVRRLAEITAEMHRIAESKKAGGTSTT